MVVGLTAKCAKKKSGGELFVAVCGHHELPSFTFGKFGPDAANQTFAELELNDLKFKFEILNSRKKLMRRNIEDGERRLYD